MTQTQAFELKKKGNSKTAFSLETITLKALNDRQVAIKVDAFGLNYADVMARRGLYREAPPMPCVIGYEVVGEIQAVGAKLSADLIGKKVVAFCRFGGYAKHVITEEYAFALIDELDPNKALALATQFVTAHYMVERSAAIQAGDRVLIHAAAGGVGSALIQLCKRKNAIVYAKIGTRSKSELVQQLGADYVIDASSSEYSLQLSQLLNSNRLDVSFNPIAGSTYKKDMRMLGSGGRMVLFGGAELSSGRWGFFSQLNFIRKMGFLVPIGLMMRSKSICGVNLLKIADNKPEIISQCLADVVQMAKDNLIEPHIGGVFGQDRFFEAHDLLESGKSVGKLIVKWD